MNRVVVAGGGVAGVTAAVRAASCGATVLLLESGDRLPPNRSRLPFLLSGRLSIEDLYSSESERMTDELDIELRTRERVDAVDHSARTVRTACGRHAYDALILATGASNVPEEMKGISKPGVFILGSLAEYVSLAQSVKDLSRVVLSAPSAPLGLVAAQELSRSVKVTLLLQPGALGRFSSGVRGRIEARAVASGVAIMEAPIEAVVGVKRVEAVVSREKVIPCDAVAVLPRSVPCLPNVDCRKGSQGGAVVDSSMRTSLLRVFAAGDCAEVRVGEASLSFKLHSSAVAMGSTAGANAADGDSAECGLAGSIVFDAFDTEVCLSGLGAAECRAAGIEVDEMQDDEGTLVSVVFERRSHRVRGLQAAGEGVSALSSYLSAIVSVQARLEDLAAQETPYLPLPDMESSPIRLTAGRLLRRLRG